jgi:hypothetical protein
LVYSGFGLDRFIQDFGLDRFIQDFGLDRFIQDFGLFRVWFRQVYTGFWFIQGLVYTAGIALSVANVAICDFFS